jgi:hypothetical protein
MLLAIGMGCASAPATHLPRQQATASTQDADDDVITYRLLTRQDFKADSLSPEANPYAKKIGAMTCARISTTPDTGFVSREVLTAAGERRVEARFRRLGFAAMMDRRCSWWNPNEALPTDYVLQHEQIHFAITELKARELDAQAPDLVKKFAVSAASHEEARAMIRAELERLLQEAMAALSERQRDFDEATSGKYDPKAQQQWLETVVRELEASAR